nr:unnamed protein product [Callosobruchus chinensis]
MVNCTTGPSKPMRI